MVSVILRVTEPGRRFILILPAGTRIGTAATRGGTIREITMRYVSRYSSHDTIRITILH